MRSQDIINASAALACAIGAVTATGPLATAGAAVSTFAAVLRYFSDQPGRPLADRIATALEQAIAAHGHLSEADRLLVPQMIAAAPLTPQDIVGTALQPAEITALILSRLQDPAHKPPLLRQHVDDVVTPLLARLLVDTEVRALLGPAFDQAVALSLRDIGEPRDPRPSGGVAPFHSRPCAPERRDHPPDRGGWPVTG
jgi:hypothetical protein